MLDLAPFPSPWPLLSLPGPRVAYINATQESDPDSKSLPILGEPTQESQRKIIKYPNPKDRRLSGRDLSIRRLGVLHRLRRLTPPQRTLRLRRRILLSLGHIPQLRPLPTLSAFPAAKVPFAISLRARSRLVVVRVRQASEEAALLGL